MNNLKLLINVIGLLLVFVLSDVVYAQNSNQRSEKPSQSRRPPQPPQLTEEVRRRQMASRKYRAALQLESRGNNGRAFEMLAELVNEYPDNNQYFEALVRNMLTLDLYEEAQKVIEDRLTQNNKDDNPDWLRAQLGAIFYQQGNPDRAELEWELCINTFPGTTRPYRTLFYQFLRMRQVDRAVDIVDRARKDLVTPSLFALNMANLYQSRMSWREALSENLLALENNLQNKDQVIRNLANFPTDSTTNKLVINKVEDSIERSKYEKQPWPGFDAALYEILVNNYNQLGDYQSALRELDVLDSLSNANGQRLLDYALELQDENQYEMAIESLRLARRRSTNAYTNEKVDYTLALFEIDQQNYSKADSILSLLITSKRRDVRGLAFLKRAELRLDYLNQVEAAYADFSQAVELSSQDQYVEAILGKARSLIFLESYEQADEILLKLFDPIRNVGKNSRRVTRQRFPVQPGSELAFEVGLLRTRLAFWQNNMNQTSLMLDSLLQQPKGSYSENDAINLSRILRSVEDSTLVSDLAQADLYIYRNKTDKAVTIYDSLMQQDNLKLNTYLEWQKILINLYYENPEVEYIITSFVTKYPENPLSEEGLLMLGEFWENKEEFDKARESYEKLIITYPEGLLVSEARLRLDILTGTEQIFIISPEGFVE